MSHKLGPVAFNLKYTINSRDLLVHQVIKCMHSLWNPILNETNISCIFCISVAFIISLILVVECS